HEHWEEWMVEHGPGGGVLPGVLRVDEQRMRLAHPEVEGEEVLLGDGEDVLPVEHGADLHLVPDLVVLRAQEEVRLEAALLLGGEELRQSLRRSRRHLRTPTSSACRRCDRGRRRRRRSTSGR